MGYNGVLDAVCATIFSFAFLSVDGRKRQIGRDMWAIGGKASTYSFILTFGSFSFALPFVDGRKRSGEKDTKAYSYLWCNLLSKCW
jgi:hypothetical protein